MTVEALSSSLIVSAQRSRRRFFLRRLVETLVDGRQRKADAYIAEYLGRHPEYRDRYARTQDSAGVLEQYPPGR